MDIRDLIEECHEIAKEKGFWDTERNVGELLMLIVSELGEALEADRKDFIVNEATMNSIARGDDLAINYWDKCKDSFQDEIADTFIRLFDLCGGLDIDILWFIKQKLEVNKKRPKLHGKKY